MDVILVQTRPGDPIIAPRSALTVSASLSEGVSQDKIQV